MATKRKNCVHFLRQSVIIQDCCSPDLGVWTNLGSNSCQFSFYMPRIVLEITLFWNMNGCYVPCRSGLFFKKKNTLAHFSQNKIKWRLIGLDKQIQFSFSMSIKWAEIMVSADGVTKEKKNLSHLNWERRIALVESVDFTPLGLGPACTFNLESVRDSYKFCL